MKQQISLVVKPTQIEKVKRHFLSLIAITQMLLLLSGIILILIGCSNNKIADKNTIKLPNHSSFKNILTDTENMSLPLFSENIKKGSKHENGPTPTNLGNII